MGKKKYSASRKRLEALDVDYLEKLSPEEREWMETFLQEYVQANFNHGKALIHKTKEQQLEIYAANNARERCIMSRTKAGGKLDTLDTVQGQRLTSEDAFSVWARKPSPKKGVTAKNKKKS